jgi:hypothetical protein
MDRKCDRRKFIQATSLGATGLALGGLVQSPGPAWGYVARDEINPNISNLRVAYVHDDAMTNGTGPVSGWANQNAVTNEAVVAANMDKMACALARRTDVGEAWRTIFIKPAAKQWNQVVVAIKTNNLGVQHTHNAVMKKMCEVLVNHRGITASNIHIYDGVTGSTMGTETPWYGLPSGTRVEGAWGPRSSWISVNVPPPYNQSATCVAAIANGVPDILINIAMCKGHSSNVGGFTMCLKNHYGTFDPAPGHSGSDYILSINKTPEILGPMDGLTGRITTPRQQLCFVDALWASEAWDPSVQPSDRPNRLFMGTFGPVLDYQVATKFRRDTMGWSINGTVANRFLTDFGYTAADVPAMVDAMAWGQSDADRRWERYE